MALDRYALTTLDEAKTYLGKTETKPGIWIFSDGASATAATVEVTNLAMILIITGGGDAGTNTLTFADSANNTLGELVAVIDALSGWKAGLLYSTNAESTGLLPTGQLNVLTSANEQTLKIVDDYLIERLIERATDIIERYCDRRFCSRDYSRNIYYGCGQKRLLLDQYPLIRVGRVSRGRANSFSILNTSTDTNYATVEVTDTVMRLIVDGGSNDDDTSLTLADYATIDALIAAINALSKGWSITTLATDTSTRDASELLIRPAMFVGTATSAIIETVDEDLTEYKVAYVNDDRDYGVLERPGVWTSGQEYFIDYTAGYAFIPFALEAACLELVKYKYDSAQASTGLKREKMGNIYEYERFGLGDLKHGLQPDTLAELDSFRKRDFE